MAAVLDDLRSFAALAWGGELAERPGLLGTWRDAFGPEDDATLVIAASPTAGTLAGLPARLAEAGLDGPDAPDLLAVEVEEDLESALALTDGVHAVLSDRLEARALGLPVVGSTASPDGLRGLAAAGGPAPYAPAAPAAEVEPSLAAAHDALASGRTNVAASLYELVLNVAPREPGAWLGLGRVRLAQRAPAAAADAARAALAIAADPGGVADAHRLLGDALVARGDLAGALASHREALAVATDAATVGATAGELHPSLDERAAQAPRIAHHLALSSCTRVTGVPTLLAPVLFAGPGRIELGREVVFGWPRSPGFHSDYAYLEAGLERSVISIGDGAFFNNGCALRSEGPGIEVGRHALFGTRVEVFDSDFHEHDPGRRRGGTPPTAPVIVGENAWIGSNTAVLKGVRIGTDAVVGAGSVVTKDVPAGVVAAGNPARVLRAL